MLEDFLSYIESKLSVNREDKILLSISGGIDSMVMLHLFRQLGFKIIVAHINHSTRKGESDKDMAFVEGFCNQHSIPFHSKTLNYDLLSDGNFQENARKERFSFLLEIQEIQECKWIATAHHQEDRWETFLMHLNRKSGIQGLTSLRPKENQIIHPLLIFSKEQITTFAGEHHIKFVHDSSNDSDAYQRNAIRHKITTEIIRLFPDFIENVNQSIQHLDNTSLLLRELIDSKELIAKDSYGDYSIISLKKIKTFKNQKTLLYHILEGFGFNYSTVCDILQTTITGSHFESSHFEGLFDRGNLIVRAKKEVVKTNMSVDSCGVYILPTSRQLQVELNAASQIDPHLWLDINKVKWPLIVRNIQPGDKFKPQGMNGATKTIKKLCTDMKINRFAKEDMLVVCNADTILQIIGMRTSLEYATDDIKNALTFNITD